MRRKHRLKELTIKDNFMFGAVMMDEENCKGLLERVLEIPIERVEVSREKSIVYHPEYKGADWMYTRRMSIKVTIMWKCMWNGKRLLEKGAGTIRVRWIWNYYYQEKIIQNFQIPMSFSSVISIHLKKKNTGIPLR